MSNLIDYIKKQRDGGLSDYQILKNSIGGYRYSKNISSEYRNSKNSHCLNRNAISGFSLEQTGGDFIPNDEVPDMYMEFDEQGPTNVYYDAIDKTFFTPDNDENLPIDPKDINIERTVGIPEDQLPNEMRNKLNKPLSFVDDAVDELNNEDLPPNEQDTQTMENQSFPEEQPLPEEQSLHEEQQLAEEQQLREEQPLPEEQQLTEEQPQLEEQPLFIDQPSQIDEQLPHEEFALEEDVSKVDEIPDKIDIPLEHKPDILLVQGDEFISNEPDEIPQLERDNTSAAPFVTIYAGTELYYPSSDVQAISGTTPIFVKLPELLDMSKQRSFTLFFTPNLEYARRFAGIQSLNKRDVYVHKLRVVEDIPTVKRIDGNLISKDIDNIDLGRGFCGPSIDGEINGIQITYETSNGVIEEDYICNPERFMKIISTEMQVDATSWVNISDNKEHIFVGNDSVLETNPSDNANTEIPVNAETEVDDLGIEDVFEEPNVVTNVGDDDSRGEEHNIDLAGESE